MKCEHWSTNFFHQKSWFTEMLPQNIVFLHVNALVSIGSQAVCGEQGPGTHLDWKRFHFLIHTGLALIPKTFGCHEAVREHGGVRRHVAIYPSDWKFFHLYKTRSTIKETNTGANIHERSQYMFSHRFGISSISTCLKNIDTTEPKLMDRLAVLVYMLYNIYSSCICSWWHCSTLF